MSKQHNGSSKPNFTSHAKAKGVKKTAVHKPSKSVKKKEKARRESGSTMIVSSKPDYCALKCGACTSCLIAKGESENNARIYRTGRGYY